MADLPSKPDPTNTISLPGLAWETARRLAADEALPLAGNIAFRMMFSIFPFLIFLTALAGFVGSEAWVEHTVQLLLSVAPDKVVSPIAREIRSILTVPRVDFLSLGALLTIWSAMAGVDSVRVCLNRAYDVIETRKSWQLYLLSVCGVIGSAILFLSLSLLVVVYPVFVRIVTDVTGSFPSQFASVEQWRYPLAVFLMLIGVHAAHRVLPAKRLTFRHVLPGVWFTVVCWMIMAYAFSIWLTRFNSFTSTYASLSGIFIIMFFVYLAALVLIAGGELNRVLELVRLNRLGRKGIVNRKTE
jgi:membrane protein